MVRRFAVRVLLGAQSGPGVLAALNATRPGLLPVDEARHMPMLIVDPVLGLRPAGAVRAYAPAPGEGRRIELRQEECIKLLDF